MAGLYDTFKTDADLEKTGVWIDYSTFGVRLAFAGGSNRKYLQMTEKRLKPLRQAIQAGTLDDERARKIFIDIYAECIVLDWQTEIDGEMRQGIEGPDGELLPFNLENVKKTLTNLPNLFNDIRTQAEMISNFRQKELEAEAGNS